MGIFIKNRPSKTLSNGFLSKWSSSELPLQYKLDSNAFPVNQFSTPDLINTISYSPTNKGTRIVFSLNHSYTKLQSILISNTNTGLDGGVYSIKEIDSSNSIIIDVTTGQTSNTGSSVRYFTNYKGLVKVFAGSPDQHPYNIDGSKPLEEIGIIEVDFKDVNGENVGFADVRGYVKAYINATFDTDENTHFGWSSYSIEVAETFDASNGVEITTFTGDFEPDVEPTCDPTPVTFVDSDFNNGLDDWLTNQTIVGGISYGSVWVDGVGSVSTSYTQGQTIGNYSEILSQDVDLYAGIPYIFTIDVVFSGGSPYSQIEILDSFGVKFGGIRITQSGVYEIQVTTDKNTNNVGIAFGGAEFGTQSNIQLNSFQVSTNVAKQCLFTQFATFGAKQFQDSLGGNFGDYVLNVVDTITPKILTHFDSKTFFKGKPFYFSGIIPASTFSLSEGGNNVFIDANLDNSQSIRVPVLNSGEGVYTVDLEPYLSGLGDWSSGTAQFIIIPTNSFADGDNGTFEDASPSNWNISSLNVLSTNLSSDGISRTGNYSGKFECSGSSVNYGETELYKFDSPIKTIIGLDYVFNAYYYNENFFSSSWSGKMYVYLKIEGTNIATNKILLDNLNITQTWIPLSFTFTPTTETINVVLCVEATEILPSGGANFLFDDITFKGPIDYISEVKPITNSKECDRYGGTLRWLNDLNGWESWNFTKKKIVKEKVSKKIDIVNDYSNDWDNSFINSETQRDTIQTTANKSIVLRSQLLNTNQKTVLQQIKRSARVQYLTDANKWQTVTIKASGYDIIDEDQKIHDMEIEINLPDLIIQAQ